MTYVPSDPNRESCTSDIDARDIPATRGGESASVGIEYQLYCSIHYFLLNDISEILLEWNDEDIVIIDEDPSGPSMDFIQCKYIGQGTLQFNKFVRDILDRFIKDFVLKKGDKLRKYGFSIYTNKGLDTKLDKLSTATEQARQGISPGRLLSLYERDIILKISEKCGEKIHWYYLLQRLEFKPNMEKGLLAKEIEQFLVSIGSSNPKGDLNNIILYIFQKKSGRITKKQLRTDLKLSYNLICIPSATELPFNTQLDQRNIDAISGEVNNFTETYNEAMVSAISDMEYAKYYGELVVDQLTASAESYRSGTLEWKKVKYAAETAEELTGALAIRIKRIKEDQHSTIRDFEELRALQKRYVK